VTFRQSEILIECPEGGALPEIPDFRSAPDKLRIESHRSLPRSEQKLGCREAVDDIEKSVSGIPR
jgi:hypothetical protein